MLSIPVAGFAQNDSLGNKLDSLTRQKENVEGAQVNNINPTAYNETTKLTVESYLILTGSNLKQAFTKPFHLNKKDWGNLGKFTAVTVALSFADKPIQKAALKLRNQNSGINDVSKYITNFGGVYEIYTLAGLGAYSLVFKNEKLKTTTLLATQAYITGAAVGTVMKFVSGRTRPSYYEPNQEAKPRFLGPFSRTTKDADGKRVYSSFPSGHTNVAFAAATVFASEYKDKPAIPIIAYSVASIIGVSRITENKHWTTDVFVGAALGFLTGKQVVNNYHRYAKIKSAESKKNEMSFNLNYSFGHWQPGLVYKWR